MSTLPGAPRDGRRSGSRSTRGISGWLQSLQHGTKVLCSDRFRRLLHDCEALQAHHASFGTNSGPAQPVSGISNESLDRRSVRVSNPVSELKRLSGLTWDEMAQLFGVSRRSVHFWASGQPLSAANEKRLLHVLDVIRGADRGDARQNRAALFGPVGGAVPFELLGAQRFEDALDLLGPRKVRARLSDAPLAQSVQDARRPLPPGVLMSALEDAAHVELGRARPARVIRVPRRADS
jgi:hypothetical protein